MMVTGVSYERLGEGGEDDTYYAVYTVPSDLYYPGMAEHVAEAVAVRPVRIEDAPAARGVERREVLTHELTDDEAASKINALSEAYAKITGKPEPHLYNHNPGTGLVIVFAGHQVHTWTHGVLYMEGLLNEARADKSAEV